MPSWSELWTRERRSNPAFATYRIQATVENATRQTSAMRAVDPSKYKAPNTLSLRIFPTLQHPPSITLTPRCGHVVIAGCGGDGGQETTLSSVTSLRRMGSGSRCHSTESPESPIRHTCRKAGYQPASIVANLRAFAQASSSGRLAEMQRDRRPDGRHTSYSVARKFCRSHT